MRYLFCMVMMVMSFPLLGLTVGNIVELTAQVNNGIPQGTNGAPQVAITPTGDAVAVWSKTLPFQIEADFFNAATNVWAAPVVIGTGVTPQVDVDSSGNAIAVWIDTTNNTVTNTNLVMAARLDVATMTWSAGVTISISGVNVSPQVSVNSVGNAVAIWVENFPFQVFGSSFDAATNIWSTPVTISINADGFPKVALDDMNLGVVVMQNFTTGDIEAVRVLVP